MGNRNGRRSEPSYRVIPTGTARHLRPTSNGSILRRGGTLRRRAHSEPELTRRPLPPLPHTERTRVLKANAYSNENLPVKRVRRASSSSGSELDLQLRPTLPRRPTPVARFSPADVWKSIQLELAQPDASSEDELLEEPRIRRLSRPVAPRPPWVPQHDLADDDSESGGGLPACRRGPPTFTLTLRPDRRKHLDPNWSLSRSLPNVVYLPGERRFAFQGGRVVEAEVEWMSRVEEGFRKQRDQEKQGIRLQLRALQETGMKKWLKRPPDRRKRDNNEDLSCVNANDNYDLSTEIFQRENKAPNKRIYSSQKKKDEKRVSRRKMGLNSFSRNHPHRGKLQQRSC